RQVVERARAGALADRAIGLALVVGIARAELQVGEHAGADLVEPVELPVVLFIFYVDVLGAKDPVQGSRRRWAFTAEVPVRDRVRAKQVIRRAAALALVELADVLGRRAALALAVSDLPLQHHRISPPPFA